MDVKDAIEKRRSIRTFDPERTVSDADIAAILEAGRLAPSWKNDQPWRFGVVRSPEILGRLADSLSANNSATKAMRSASAAIVLIAVPAEGAVHQDKDFWLVDCGIAGENMYLRAVELGISSVWVSLLDNGKVCGALDLPEGMQCVGIFPLGYALPEAEDRPRVPRRPLEELTFFERYGQPFVPAP